MDKTKKQGVRAQNQDFIRYDQVNKSQKYFLSEAKEEEFDEGFEIKTCDMSEFLLGSQKEANAFASKLGNALKEIGFAILVGHNVDQEVYRQAEKTCKHLFSQTPLEEKLKFSARRFGAVNQGYFPIKETTDIHPDLVEGWVFCRRAFALDNTKQSTNIKTFWPNPSFEKTFRKLYLAQQPLILPIMQSLLRYLGADPHLYDQKLSKPAFGLRLNYYPPITQEDKKLGAGRLLGHEDVNMFTLLPAPEIEGLQVLHRKTGKWIRLHAPPGSIILNIGDYMQRISNDIFPSTTHRVSIPRDENLLARARVSFPINIYLEENEILEVLPNLPPSRYQAVQVLDFHTRITSKYYGDEYVTK